MKIKACVFLLSAQESMSPLWNERNSSNTPRMNAGDQTEQMSKANGDKFGFTLKGTVLVLKKSALCKT